MGFSDASLLPQHPQVVVWRLICACAFLLWINANIFPHLSGSAVFMGISIFQPYFCIRREVEDTLGADLKLKV